MLFGIEKQKIRVAFSKANKEKLNAKEELEKLELAKIDLDSFIKQLEKGRAFVNHTQIIEYSLEELLEAILQIVKPHFFTNSLDTTFNTKVEELVKATKLDNIKHIDRDTEYTEKGYNTYLELFLDLYKEFNTLYTKYKYALADSQIED